MPDTFLSLAWLNAANEQVKRQKESINFCNSIVKPNRLKKGLFSVVNFLFSILIISTNIDVPMTVYWDEFI